MVTILRHCRANGITDSARLIRGRLFQRLGALTTYALSPLVFSRASGTETWLTSA